MSDRLGKNVCMCFLISGLSSSKRGDCRSKLHDDDESRLIQVVLMITKMMTKSPRE